MIRKSPSIREVIQSRSAELRKISLRTKRSINADLIGNYRSSFRGTGLNFSELREYSPGDEIKYIDWRASARSGKTYVKSFEEERQLTIMLAVDTSHSTGAGFGATMHHRALLFSSLLTTLASINNDLCGLMLFSDTINTFLRPSNKRSQSQQILSVLSASRAHAKTDINSALNHFLMHFRKRTILFIISDFYAPPFENSLKHSAKLHDTILVIPEINLSQLVPPQGIVQLNDPETGAQILFDSSNKKSRLFLERKLKEREQELLSLAKNNNCECLLLGDDPLQPLVKLMQQRHKRGII